MTSLARTTTATSIRDPLPEGSGHDQAASRPAALCWELIRCPGCGREHARRATSVLVLSCLQCGGQPEVYSLLVGERLELAILGRVGARVVGRQLAGEAR
jgi:hypothetical protein